MSEGLGNEQDGPNRRKATRHRILMGGLIVTPCGSGVLECTVLDSSETCAKVRVLSERPIAKEFHFVHSNTGTFTLLGSSGSEVS
jgi:hypothetical protein